MLLEVSAPAFLPLGNPLSDLAGLRRGAGSGAGFLRFNAFMMPIRATATFRNFAPACRVAFLAGDRSTLLVKQYFHRVGVPLPKVAA